jgi:hypothetical protein
MKHFCLLIFLLPLTCFAQITITGKLINATDKTAVADASVFLSNATVGNKSANDGSFILHNVKPGQYELVVTVVGYETYRQTLMAGTENLSLPDIKLTPKTNELKEVVIKPDPDWEWKYDTFKREFLGSSDLAKECKILNPQMVDLEFDKASRTLNGSSYDFLEIENKALGYKIKYLLAKFIKNNKSGLVYFEGSALFEDMKGTPKQQRRWLKNRRIAYEGSSMHFLRAAVGNNVEGNGFKVLRLIRTPNPNYNGFNEKYSQTLVNVSLKDTEYTSITDVKGIFALKFADCLYLMYTKKRDSSPDNKAVQSLTMPNYPTSILSFEEPYALFDRNGVILNPASINFEGSWGKNRVAEMLPVDYTPEEK